MTGRRNHPHALRSRLVWTALLVGTLGCGSGDPSPTEPAGPGAPPTPSPPSTPPLVLASGELALPGALQEGDPGSHEVLIANHRLGDDLAATSGRTLVVALRDTTRPGLVCSSDEPEDGCATVDWSEDPSRPRVPPDGVFLNRLDLELVSGPRRLYLSRTFHLNDLPDRIDPQREHTAIGGVPLEWSVVLPAALAADSSIELRLIMTKWLAPNVRIGYRVLLVGGD